MLKEYAVTFCQADLEFLSGCLSYYQNQLHPFKDDPMREEICQMRQKLNEALPCDVPECENKRAGMDEQCSECEDHRKEMKALYGRNTQHISRDDIMDVYHDDEHKRAVMLHELGYE